MSHIPPPKELKAFPDAVIVKSKTMIIPLAELKT